MYPQPRTNRKNSVSLGSTQLWEGKDITLQKSILYLSKHSFRRSDQILTWVLSVCSSISFWCVCVCVFVLCENVCWLGILLMGDVLFSPDKAQWWRLWLYPGREKQGPHHQICREGLPSWGEIVHHTCTFCFVLWSFTAMETRRNEEISSAEQAT